MTLPGLHPNPRPTPTPAAPMTEDERTRTLQGLGLDRATLRGLGGERATGTPERCPCCRIKRDAVPADLAGCFTLALVAIEGAPPVRHALCTMHARLLRLLIDEIRNPPTQSGASWDD
jgi:hypothetical protein